MDTDRTTTNNNFQSSTYKAFKQVQPRHLTEWNQSSVDDKLTELNLTSLSGLTTYDHLLYALPDKDRRNDGRLRDKFLQRYQHLEHGGWYIAGLDPDTNWADLMVWGRFKPDAPRTGSNGKLVKYESPPKTPNRVTYFRVPLHLWSRVASRYGIKRYHSPLALRLTARTQPVNFWSWVKSNPEIPIILAEGEKKAGSLISKGYAAISLPGIWGGRQPKNRDPEKKLHQDLLPLAQPGRTFIILFDYDQKQSTREAVYKAILATGEAIKAAGANCKVALLPGPEKGVDDFITARGDSASAHLARIIDNAHPLEEYRWIGNPDDDELIKYAPENPICVPYLPHSTEIDLDTPGSTGINSGMATGKTSSVKILRERHPERRFLVIGHRISLLRELSQPNKLNTNLYLDLPIGQLDKVDSLSITIDSLYKLKTVGNKYDYIFIDEARQVMNHALAATTCKEHRQEILMSLMYFIRTAKQVIYADAHLDDNSVDFFHGMRPVGEIPLIIKNNYQSPSRDVYYYQGGDSTAIVAKLIAAVEQGKRVMVVSDSKNTIKKLEAVLTKKLAHYSGKEKKIIWSIHAENSGSEENQHFINNISTAVEDVDVLLASPSLCTGVDIQGDRFDEVYGVFNAVSLSATDCLQALHRYRKQVPLHIWVAPRPSFGYQNTNPNVIKQEMLTLNEFNGFLMGIDLETGEKTPVNGWAFDAYCQVKAKHNRSLNNLRDHLHRLLARMGYNIISVEEKGDDDAKSELKSAKKQIDEHHVRQVTTAEKIDKQRYLQLKNKANLALSEQYQLERFRIESGYGLEVTEDLVKRDKGGALLGQLINLEAVLSPHQGEAGESNINKNRPVPPQIVLERDRWELDNLPFLPDRQHHCAQWMMWQTLGLPKILERLFAGEEYSASDPELIKLAETANSYRDNIKTILGFWIPDRCSPTWLLGMLLGKLGLKTASRKKGSSGQQVKYYSLALEELVFAQQVLEYRQAERIKREERKRQRQEENRLYRVMIETQYGITDSAISTPDQNSNFTNLQQGVNMPKTQTQTILDKIQFTQTLIKVIVDRGRKVIQRLLTPTLSLNLSTELLIRYLNNPMRFIF